MKLKIRAEIFAVGDELCYGRVYDTNSFWIANRVTRLGVLVQRITCVRDDLEDILAVLGEALKRKPRFVFITGGLGPTPDDKTIEALSQLTNRRIVFDQNTLRRMAERIKRPIDQLLPVHVKMASSLEGAECLPNPVGVAPVTILRLEETTIAALPGPPKEMRGCFKRYLVKIIQETTGYCSLARRVAVTMFESEVTPLIRQIMKTMPETYLKPLVSKYQPDVGLPVEIIVFERDERACQQRYEEVIRKFKDLVDQKGRKIIWERKN